MSQFPDWIEPMAATLTYERFTGPEWIFERKLDGIRLLAFKNGADVKLFSRNHLPQTIPAVAGAIARLAVPDMILDGEMTWGKSAYHVFDVMWLDGREVMSLPLVERRALLATLPLRTPLERVAALDDPKPWERACSEGWEGVVAKRRDSVYEQRRSVHWLKMKCEASQELVIGGFTDPRGSRVGLGALLVGYFEQGELLFAGKVGTGFDRKLLLELRARLDALEIPETPFTKGVSRRGAGAAAHKTVGLPRSGAHWVRPQIVAQVAFIEWTVHGKLRHPRFVGIRDDKLASDVVREAL